MPPFDEIIAPTPTMDELVKCIGIALLLWLPLRVPERFGRTQLFVLFNMTALAVLYSLFHVDYRYLLAYAAIVVGLYYLLKLCVRTKAWMIATIVPIALLLLLRAMGPSASVVFAGASYMAFRLSQLAVIVRNGIVPMPTLSEYLAFSFFVPTLFIGPISSYSTFITSFSKLKQITLSGQDCLLRILVGMAKYLFLANVVGRVSYKGLILDGHTHPPVDLLIASVAYYLYLYCNFSGACDIVIGTSGLLGIKVSENFDAPFAARNLLDFWNRWHITLSTFMREMFFSPVSSSLVRRCPASMSAHAIALTIAAVFILIGLWHGSELNFFLFGVSQALGAVCVYYYGLWLKRNLSPEQRLLYRRSKLVKSLAIGSTFVYMCGSLFFLANSPSDMHEIFQRVELGSGPGSNLGI